MMSTASNVAVSLAAAVCAVTALADEFIGDDLIVQGSQCIGVACTNLENFGFDTIKLKTDDPVLRFVDTSVGSFSSNDWVIGISAGDSAGPARFFINDVDGGATVLLMEAGQTGGIALGAWSEVETSAVSVGAEGLERRIVHVEDGIADTDAATVGQLEATTGARAGELDAGLATLQQAISELSGRLDAVISRLDGE